MIINNFIIYLIIAEKFVSAGIYLIAIINSIIKPFAGCKQ